MQFSILLLLKQYYIDSKQFEYSSVIQFQFDKHRIDHTTINAKEVRNTRSRKHYFTSAVK